MNKRLIKTLEDNNDKIAESQYIYIYIDTYNDLVRTDGIIGTITTGVDYRNHIFIGVKKNVNKN